MTTYRAHFALNPDARFLPYTDGDRLLMISGLVVSVEGNDEHDAAEEAFRVGQKIGQDYPRWCRSLSVGDVVVVQSIDGQVRHHMAVDAVGFREIPEPTYFEATRGMLADAGLAALTDGDRR